LSIDESVSSMRAMLRSIIRNDVTLTFDFAGEPALVVIDPQELEQVLVNLVLNAVDAEPHGGAIRVSTGVVTIGGEPGRQEIRAAAGRYVRLRVSDTGTGMPPDVLAHLFEPFFTTKEVGQGTGLGLAAVDGIVRSNRGVVTVESTVGEGSTFSVYFPAAPAGARADAADAAGAAPAASAVSEKRGNGETILLIEDEAPVRAIVVRTLERAGYRMLSAAGPLPALEIFEQHAQRIALVVSDIVMPDMHGPAVVEALKAQRPDLRVLFISGYSEETLEDLPPGARLLKKPFAPSALVAAVGEALLAHSAAAR
jgi:CheY-like chemotaxis protein